MYNYHLTEGCSEQQLNTIFKIHDLKLISEIKSIFHFKSSPFTWFSGFTEMH